MSTWESALDDLTRTRLHHLFAYALMLTGSREQAQDLVQDALISVYSSRARLDNRTVAESYVRRAIASKFIDSTRSARRDKERLRSLRVVTPLTASPHDDGVGLRTDIAKALQLIPARERACVVLRHLEQLSTRETANVLGISEGAVKRYLADGIGQLQGLLGEHVTASDHETVSVSERGHRNA